MRPIVAALGFLASLTFITGCGQQEAAPSAAAPAAGGGLAVIDLDKLAAQLGRDIEVTEKVQQKQAELNKQLSRAQTSFKEQFAEKQTSMGEDVEQLTDEQIQELRSYEVKLARELAQLRRQAEVELETYKQRLIRNFREQVRPVAQEVAQSRGFSVVIPHNDSLLLSIEPSADITSAVSQKMQAGSSNSESSERTASGETDTATE